MNRALVVGLSAATLTFAGSGVASATGSGSLGPTSPAPAAPTGVTTTESSYPTNHGPEAMTVYRSSGATVRNAAAVVMVHGGAWIRGSRALLDSEARQAAAAGFVVFDIDYDLAAPRYPRQVQDVESAIDFIHNNARRFGISPNRIGALGTSAGANLLMEASTSGHAPLKAVVGWSGPYDLTGRGGLKDIALAGGSAAVYLGCIPVLPSCAKRAADASPARHVVAGTPRALLFNSANELIPLNQMTDFASALRAVGTPVETHVVPGTGHAVAYAGQAIGPTLSFLERYL